MPLSCRPQIASLSPCPHGGPQGEELRALGLAPEEVVDFSVSINPFGPPPGVREAVAAAPIELYPDPQATELLLAIGERLGVGVGNLLMGSGATELIRLAALAYLSPGDGVLIPQPTFGEYEMACLISGARVVKVAMREEEGFALNIGELVGLIQRRRPKAVFLCNPNNPTGGYLGQEEVVRVVEACDETLVVVDEAFIPFVAGAWPSPPLISYDNLLLLRSLTKDYALAGLRLGYAIGNPETIGALRRVCPPWNVSIAALRAGAAALKAEAWLRESLQKIEQARQFLMAGLSRLGLAPLPSQAPFFLVKVGDAPGLRRALLGYGILVRDCSSFGLPQYIRLAPRPLPQCQRLLEALTELKRQGAWGV